MDWTALAPLAQGGGWAIVGAFVLAIMRGWLVTGKQHEDRMQESRDYSTKLLDIVVKQAEIDRVRADTSDRVLDGLRTLEQLVRSLPVPPPGR